MADNEVSIIAQLRGNLLQQLKSLSSAFSTVRSALGGTSAAANTASTSTTNLGKAAQTAAAAFSAAGRTIALVLSGILAGISRLTSAMGALVKGITSGFNSIIGSFTSFKGLLVGFVGALGLDRLVNSLKVVAEKFNEIALISKRLNVSNEFFSGLVFGAEQFGIKLDTLEISLRQFQANLGKNFRNATIEVRRVLENIGFDFEEAAARGDSFEAQLSEIVDLLNEVPDYTVRIDAYRQLFGEIGPKLVSLFDSGSLGIKEFVKQAKLLNVSLEDDTPRIIRELIKAFNRFEAAIEGIKLAILTEAGPAITVLIQRLTALLSLVPKVSRGLVTKFSEAFGIFSEEDTKALSPEKLKERQDQALKAFKDLIENLVNLGTAVIAVSVNILFNTLLNLLKVGWAAIKPTVLALGKDLVFSMFDFEVAGVNLSERLGLARPEEIILAEREASAAANLAAARRAVGVAQKEVERTSFSPLPGSPEVSGNDFAFNDREAAGRALAAAQRQLESATYEYEVARAAQERFVVDSKDAFRSVVDQAGKQIAAEINDSGGLIREAFQNAGRAFSPFVPNLSGEFNNRLITENSNVGAPGYTPVVGASGEIFWLPEDEVRAQESQEDERRARKREARRKVEERETREFEARRFRAIGFDAEADLQEKQRVNKEVLQSLEAQLDVAKRNAEVNSIDLEFLQRKVEATRQIQAFEEALQRVKIIRARSENERSLSDSTARTGQGFVDLQFRRGGVSAQGRRDAANEIRAGQISGLETFRSSLIDIQNQLIAVGEAGSLGFRQVQAQIDATNLSIQTLQQESKEAASGFGESFGKGFSDFITAAADTQKAAETLGAAIGEALTSGVAGALFSIIDGTKSVGEAFADLGRSILETIFKVVTQLLIAKAIQSAFLLGGGGLVGSTDMRPAPVHSFAGGGLVPGHRTPNDVVSAKLRKGEYVTTPEATGYYGTDVMNAINRQMIPREPLRALAGVGQATFAGISSPIATGGNGGGSSQTIVQPVMVADGKTMDRLLAGGKNEFLNFLADNRDRVKAIIQ